MSPWLPCTSQPFRSASWFPPPAPCSLVDQLTSQHAEELGTVQCGQPFALEVEALDAFNNRCALCLLLCGRLER